MSLVSSLLLAAVLISQVQDLSSFSVDDARAISINNNHPGLVVLTRSGSGQYERVEAVVASAETLPDQVNVGHAMLWSARRVIWTPEGVTISEVVTHDTCPGFRNGVDEMASALASIRPNLSATPSIEASGAVPYPDRRLHRSVTVWTEGRQVDTGGDYVQAEYTASGGPLADAADGLIKELTMCRPSSSRP